jgi:hypothetical protein
MHMQPQVETPSHPAMMQIIHGTFVSRCVSVIAELGIADLLAAGPRDAVSLAVQTGANPDALYRVLRMLAGLGIFAETANRSFQNSSLSDVLRSDAPGSLRNYARWMGCGLHWRTWGDIEYSVRTGNSALLKQYPDKTPFEVLAGHPAEQEIFNHAMTGFAAADCAAIGDAYDFSRFGRIVDVGGGHGSLALTIAAKAPQAKVSVFDLPQVIQGTRQRLSGDPLAKRMDLVSGSFLDYIPAPVDLCVLKNIVHDWDDENAQRILSNCRKALSDNGRVLICEMMVTAGPEAIPALVLDMEMLVAAGGRERTRTEFSELLSSAGLRLERVLPTRTPIQLLEAVPVD